MSSQYRIAAGIDDLSIYVPKLYITAEDFANARGVDKEKLTKGLGVEEMAMVDSDQNPATMAANAALRVIERNDIEPYKIGRLYVATESSQDNAKPMNSDVIGMLEQVYGKGEFRNCGGYEGKFACISGSYMMDDLLNWIRGGESRGKYGMVIVSDIAKYDLESEGEATQGAGAVAVLLSDDPKLLKFDNRVTATSIRDEHDFYKPDHSETPVVHGQYSNLLYLAQMKDAFEGYKKNVKETGLIDVKEDESILDHIDYFNMHLPYSNMGKKAISYLMRHEYRNLPRWKGIIEKIGMDEPTSEKSIHTIDATLQDEEFMKKDKKFTSLFTKTEEFKKFFNDKMASSLIASKMIGNLYTGSLFMGFRSNMEFEHKKGVDLEGKRVGFGAYGSGSSAMVFSGLVQPTYREVTSKMDFEKDMAGRKRLENGTYEMLHENRIPINEPLLPDKKHEFRLESIETSTDRKGERHYVFAE